MATVISPSALRADLYRLLDTVLDTGEPIEVRRRGRVLRIVLDGPISPLDALPRRPDAIVGDPSDLDDVHFADAWSGAADVD